MARAGDEEGKGQEAQKGGRRLILRSRLPPYSQLGLITYLSPQYVPYTPHARNSLLGISVLIPLLSNAFFHTFIAPFGPSYK